GYWAQLPRRNPDLVAERGAEYEIGFDAAAFDDRLGVEFTYYDKRMRDVIISTGAAGSTGFGNTFYGATTSVLKNLGETHNSGVELGITATPVQTRRFAWDARVSLTTNDNELVSFGDARPREAVSGQSFATVQEHRAGYPLAGYWAQLPRRNPDGTPVLNSAGVVQLDTATYIGPSAPTHEISFSNTFTFLRDFSVYVLLDHKGGHYIYNHKEFNRCGTATVANCERINNPANANHPELPVWRQVRAAYIEKADFVKLRDLSLTYTVPTAWAQRFRATAASLTLAGRNLALWSDYSGIDPEVNGYGSGGITGGGIARNFARADIFPVPMTRRVSVSLNLSF
ncbi:MAG TPA: TonB-dependent receptor, partial [Longimicrobiaceae bacterium]|nr:TonB-dependent receptor [Longimicrobiaceae bacterium]